MLSFELRGGHSRLCYLIYVDALSRVQLIHQTARGFLLHTGRNSEFGVDRKTGHGRLLMTYLEYLNGNEMKGPARRNLSVSNVAREHEALANYACGSFSEHVFQASSQDDDTLVNLRRFLGSSNVLCGIEYVAGHSDLNCLIRTANAFKNFLQRRHKNLSPFGKDIVLADSWATDLVHIVTKFGKILIVSPSSIYYLIPPFCPQTLSLENILRLPTVVAFPLSV